MSVLPVGFGSQGGGGYTIKNSLRFRPSASAYLSRAQGSATSTTTGTWSGWCKRGKLGVQQFIWSSVNYDFLQFNTDDKIRIAYLNNSGYVSTAAVYRDPSAWYHIVLVFDTTNATAVDRMRLYVNGVQQTLSWGATPQTQNATFQRWNKSGYTGDIGDFQYNHTAFFDGYMAECYWVDGQALAPSDFGEYNENTGVWQPVEYEGTYGNNGFYLPFSDATNTTTLVADSSGNGNDWTPNNISLTSGVTYDSMTDTPTIYAGGGNYAVMNPLHKSANATLSDGNLKIRSAVTGQNNFAIATITLPTDKFYFEVTAGNNTGAVVVCEIGLVVPTTQTFAGTNSGIQCVNGGLNKIVNGVYTSIGGGLTTGTVLGFAYDLVNGLMTIYRDGTAVATDETIPTTFRAVLASVYRDTANDVGWEFNFGQHPFAHTPPTGFKALHTGNLPDSTIVSGDDYFKTYLYTGNGGGLQVGEIQKPFTTYEVSNSLRFRASASAYLSRTPASAGNRKTWTWSAWVKRGKQGVVNYISGTPSNYTTAFRFEADGKFYFTGVSGTQFDLRTNQVFRDPSAWYHIIIAFDTTQATTSNRIKMYVNGSEITSFYTASYPTLNLDGAINNNAYHGIGTPSSGDTHDGYLAEVNFIDGQALTPSDLGDYDGNNYWVPKAYTGTYGTNGFYLDFSDTTSTATLVADQSGAGNDWTPNNISLTAGSTYDSMVDSPTPYADAGNYAVLNPLSNLIGGNYPTMSNGNLSAARAGIPTHVWGTFGIAAGDTTSWYWEGVCTTLDAARTYIGIIDSTTTTSSAPGASYAFVDKAILSRTGAYYNTASGTTGSSAGTYTSYAVNDVVMIAYQNGKIWFGKNGTWMNSGNPAAGTGAIDTAVSTARTWIPYFGYNSSWTANFGQRPFAYTPPTGFKTLNSFNIPEVTNDLETPDLVWIKSRSAAQSHTLFDSVRGVHDYLKSDNTALEVTDVNSLLQFNKNGFLLGASAAVNTSGRTYVGWGWKAGTAFSNDAGTNGATIASVGSVNQDAGFSIVTYTGNSTQPSTVGHGLGVAPSMVIVKTRNSASYDWNSYHVSLGNTKYIALNSTAAASSAVSLWNNTSPTSTVFSLNHPAVNTSSNTYVAYCFADVEGYSKFGSYVGNNSPDGPFVYLGFRPAFLIIRSTSAGRDWLLWDTARGTANGVGVMDGAFQPNTPGTAYTGAGYEGIDLLSNGFKWRNNLSANYNGAETYIYMAFAENPFKNSLAR